MNKKTSLRIGAIALTTFLLSGCSQEQRFSATNAEEFERQHYQFINQLPESDRDRYEISISTLILFSEGNLGSVDLSDDKHLTATALLVKEMSPSDVIELASRPEYAEYRELAMQLIVYGNSAQWQDEKSQDISINVNDLSDIDRLKAKKEQWEQDRESLRRITLLDTNVSVEDGAKSYQFTLENNSHHLVYEVTLAFRLTGQDGLTHNENVLSYSFPTPLSRGETYHLDIRESRPQTDIPDEHYMEDVTSQGTLRVSVRSLMTDEGIIGGEDRVFTDEDARRLELLISEMERNSDGPIGD